MISLYLDDERPTPVGWVGVKTTHEAKAALQQHQVHKMSLDHDLGQPDGETGTNFVEWMAKTRKWPDEKPEVHSANPYGAKAMRALIDRTFGSTAARDDVHPAFNRGHIDCSDPACCSCGCLNCMQEWRRAGRPMSTDCSVHGRK